LGIEHDIQYKSTDVIPREIRRRFKALAGVLELADREFQAIQHADEAIQDAAERKVLRHEQLADVEITPRALKAYLDKLLGPDGRLTDFSYDYEARTLRRLGFTNFAQIDECVRGFDADRLNYILLPTRQGQNTRFDYLLTAGMAENFLNRHPLSTNKWFQQAIRDRITSLRTAGVELRNYDPGPSKGWYRVPCQGCGTELIIHRDWDNVPTLCDEWYLFPASR
jgi:putative GTP pyrophosphokinase